MTELERTLEVLSKRHLTLFRKIADAVLAKRLIDARTQREMERLPEIKELLEQYTQKEMWIALHQVVKEMIANRETT